MQQTHTYMVSERLWYAVTFIDKPNRSLLTLIHKLCGMCNAMGHHSDTKAAALWRMERSRLIENEMRHISPQQTKAQWDEANAELSASEDEQSVQTASDRGLAFKHSKMHLSDKVSNDRITCALLACDRLLTE